MLMARRRHIRGDISSGRRSLNLSGKRSRARRLSRRVVALVVFLIVAVALALFLLAVELSA